ncbi:MAG: MerR family transcriptional regulator [Desulfuromonadales bacterium]|nr:MerR family transcriptional regulator [Desulfuromonadales bacterium]NIR33814.1 MerR family transcriptional regulator [Desulfuromonadales bacterium]NIS41403.1 MerR family transcriptional regulator [Desulfuromonadales bacterium]
MSLGKTWFTIEKAVDKFGISKETLLEWVEEGLVRTEEGQENVVLVNADDILLQESNLDTEA